MTKSALHDVFMLTTKHPFILGSAVAILFLATLPALLRAQAGSGELAGEVHDPSSAVVAGARVTLKQTDTNETLSSVTNESGIYSFSALKPGLYDLTIEAAGFKRAAHEQIRVTTAERIRVDVQLEIGRVEDSLTITGDAPPLRTESPTMAQSVRTEMVQGLPLNGRNFVPLV
jgi:hypothetical protein